MLGVTDPSFGEVVKVRAGTTEIGAIVEIEVLCDLSSGLDRHVMSL